MPQPAKHHNCKAKLAEEFWEMKSTSLKVANVGTPWCISRVNPLAFSVVTEAAASNGVIEEGGAWRRPTSVCGLSASSAWLSCRSCSDLLRRGKVPALEGCEGTMKTLVIGLGGVTNGGKTTLARKLKKLLPSCTIISQDDFFKPESEVAKDDRGFLQYDVLDALYMETMVASIRSWMTKPEDSALPRPPNNTHDDQTGAKDIRVLIIEGFLLFNYKPLSDIWDKKYFLTIPYEECKRRRSNRIYNPPDPPGYFDGHVWPMYQKHRREMEENEASIVYLDGTKPQEDLCSRIYDDIMQELEKTSEQGIMHA